MVPKKSSSHFVLLSILFLVSFHHPQLACGEEKLRKEKPSHDESSLIDDDFLGTLPPGCQVDFPSWIGDGRCDGRDYNTEECEWDGSDCDEFNEMYPGCFVDYPSFVGDGRCDLGEYNTEECDWDGGDCEEFYEYYPNCTVEKPYYIGDGNCNFWDYYNTEECGWDRGDCHTKNHYLCLFQSINCY